MASETWLYVLTRIASSKSSGDCGRVLGLRVTAQPGERAELEFEGEFNVVNLLVRKINQPLLPAANGRLGQAAETFPSSAWVSRPRALLTASPSRARRPRPQDYFRPCQYLRNRCWLGPGGVPPLPGPL